MRMNGGQALIKALEPEDVEVLFGYPGGVALPIFDALFDSTKIRTILTRHEQGATHVLGTDAFQEVDVTGITLPVVKHSYLVKDAEQIVETVKEAFHIASTGRPGPVVVDLPVDVLKTEIAYHMPETVNLPGYKPTFKGHARQVREAASLISRARKPILYAGGGVLASGAAKELKELAELMQLPVTTTLMGKGAFPEDHHLYIGMPGMHGPKYTNYSLTETDLLVAVG